MVLTSSIFTLRSSCGGQTTDHLDLDRDLVSGALEGELGLVLAHAPDLEQHGSWTDAGGPVLDVALAGAHARLGRLARHGLVREDADVDLGLAARRAVRGNPRGLELARGDPAPVERLQPEVPEGDRVAARGHALQAP